MLTITVIKNMTYIVYAFESSNPQIFLSLLKEEDYEEIYNELPIRIPKNWDYSTALDGYSTEEAYLMIKCIVALEENRRGRGGGSVSEVIPLFKQFEKRDLEKSKQLADWILKYTTNIYLPFGTYNYDAKSLEEYYEGIRKKNEYRMVMETKRIDEQRNQREKRKQKINVHLIRIKEHEHLSKVRQKLLDHIQTLPIDQRITAIAKDNKNPISFYPKEYAVFDYGILKKMDKKTLLLLRQKLKNMRSGNWRKLYKYLSGLF